MKVINRYADEVIEQRTQEKLLETGRSPEDEGETRRPGMAGEGSRKAGPSGRAARMAKRKTENFQRKEKRGVTNFPKRE